MINVRLVLLDIHYAQPRQPVRSSVLVFSGARVRTAQTLEGDSEPTDRVKRHPRFDHSKPIGHFPRRIGQESRRYWYYYVKDYKIIKYSPVVYTYCIRIHYVQNTRTVNEVDFR